MHNVGKSIWSLSAKKWRSVMIHNCRVFLEEKTFFLSVLVLNNKLMILIRSFFEDIVNNGLTRINNLCYEHV